MTINSFTANTRSIVAPSGRFDFSIHKAFRQACEAALKDPRTTEIEIDLSKVEYIDSSALGMLLLLKDQADAAGKAICLSGMQGMVRKVLEVANFAKLIALRQ